MFETNFTSLFIERVDCGTIRTRYRHFSFLPSLYNCKHNLDLKLTDNYGIGDFLSCYMLKGRDGKKETIFDCHGKKGELCKYKKCGIISGQEPFLLE